VLVAPLGLLATECGWGRHRGRRQPWIIYNVMRTRDAGDAERNLVVTLTTLQSSTSSSRSRCSAALPSDGRGPALRPAGGNGWCDVIPPLETMIAGIMAISLTSTRSMAGADFGGGIWDLSRRDRGRGCTAAFTSM